MPKKKSIWITYAWKDNEDHSVDFIAQELGKKLEVKLDRWDLEAGKILWEQIGSYIQDPSESDGWLIYATQSSLSSKKCNEELYYALDRALDIRGAEFPIIGLFPGSFDKELIPSSLKIRLNVSITDPEWQEKVVAAIEKRKADIKKPHIEPYILEIYELNNSGKKKYAIEIRPRGGTWSPFIAAIPFEEKDWVNQRLHFGPANHKPDGNLSTSLYSYKTLISEDGIWWIESAINEATPTQSYYLICERLPSSLIFGKDGDETQYKYNF